MKHSVIFFFFILISTISLSQSDFRKGFVITYENDTIEGYIDYKGSYKNLKKCRFKSNLEGDLIDYTPNEIKAFRYDIGNYFEAISISIKENKELLFIEKLVDGIVDVYFYLDNGTSKFLISKEGAEMQELTNTIKVVERNGETYKRDNKEYLGVLSFYFQDSPETLSKLEHTSFAPNSIISISEFYHNQVCNDYSCMVYSKLKLKPKIRFGVLMGQSLSNIEFSRNKFVEELNFDYSSSSNFSLGGFINLSDPKISERVSLQLEGVFQNATYSKDSLLMKISFFKVPITVKYSLPSKKIYPSLLLGLEYSRWLKYSDSNIAPENQQNVAVQSNRNQYGFLSAMELAYPFRSKTIYFIQGRYEYLLGRHINSWKTYAYGLNVTYVQDVFYSKMQIFSIVGGIKF